MVVQVNNNWQHQREVEQYGQANAHVLKQIRDGHQAPAHYMKSSLVKVVANVPTKILSTLSGGITRRSFTIQVARGYTLTDYIYIKSDNTVGINSGYSMQSESSTFNGSGEYDLVFLNNEVWAYSSSTVEVLINEILDDN